VSGPGVFGQGAAPAVWTRGTSIASGSRTTWWSTTSLVTPGRGRPTREAASGTASIIGRLTRGWSDRGQSAIPPDHASRVSGQVTIFVSTT